MSISPLDAGERAPQFSLPDYTGRRFSRADFAEELLVIFFYPRDNTPGCTREARDFSALLNDFRKEGADIIGISGGDSRSKERFCTKHNLAETMLSDEDFTVARKFGCFGKKVFMGRTFDGIHRTTFVVAKNGTIVRTFLNVTAAGHAAEVLKFIREWRLDRQSSAAKKRSRAKTPARKRSDISPSRRAPGKRKR